MASTGIDEPVARDPHRDARARCCRRACSPTARRRRCRCCCRPTRTRRGSRRSRARRGWRRCLCRPAATLAIAVPISTTSARNQEHERGHLHLVGLDLLAEVLGRAADHQPGDEHGDDGEHQHAVQAAADAAEDDLAQLHQPHRHQPAERRERVVHRVDRAVRRGGGRGRPQRGVRDAEADLLAFHVAAGLRCAEPPDRRPAPSSAGLPACSAAIAPTRQRHEDHEHRGQQRPALARVADHRAERVAERRRNQQDRQHLEEVRQRRRVLERMRRVDVEEPAAVGAELLDRDLAGGGSQRDGLLRDRRLLHHWAPSGPVTGSPCASTTVSRP